MKVLMVGDVVGRDGRETLKLYLDRNKHKYDLIIVNGENAAGGFGLTCKIADEILSLGCDVITSGNHIWDKRELYGYLDNTERVLRPVNYPEGVPGKGYTIVEAKDGHKVCVISLQGRVFMPPIDCPFVKIKQIIEQVRNETKYIIIDFHGEATSEKIAMGWQVDGHVSILVGTHTHVQTADNKILPDGTGYISDLGMTGSDNGVIGMSRESVLPKFFTSLPQKFDPAEGNDRINAIEAILDENGSCTEITRINKSRTEIELT